MIVYLCIVFCVCDMYSILTKSFLLVTNSFYLMNCIPALSQLLISLVLSYWFSFFFPMLLKTCKSPNIISPSFLCKSETCTPMKQLDLPLTLYLPLLFKIFANYAALDTDHSDIYNCL